jgi:hypothetical protein
MQFTRESCKIFLEKQTAISTTEVLAKIHASVKSMILAILCQNLQAGSVGGRRKHT